MPLIHLTNFIASTQEKVFDLSRTIDVHLQSMNRYGEKAVGEKRTGMMNKGDEVTWEARHLGKNRQMTVRITDMRRPGYFKDEQVKGDFTCMRHEHYFNRVENGTIMIDQFYYEVPYGFLGNLFDRLYLKKYMTRLLQERNAVLKRAAEGSQSNNI